MELAALESQLGSIVGAQYVRGRPAELLVFESDGLPGYRKRPSLAVFPGTRDELVAVVQLLAREQSPSYREVPAQFVRWRAGGRHRLIGLNRLTRILDVDVASRLAVVEPGVVNASLSRAAAQYGLHYAPTFQQAACTIGGNVAENAGGPHCLKYGVTLNHVRGGHGGASRRERHHARLRGRRARRLRLVRRLRRIRRVLRNRAGCQRAPNAQSGRITHVAGRLSLYRCGGPARPPRSSPRDRSRCTGNDGRGDDPRGRASIYAAGYPVDAAAVLLLSSTDWPPVGS